MYTSKIVKRTRISKEQYYQINYLLSLNSDEDISELVGVSKSTVGRIRKGFTKWNHEKNKVEYFNFKSKKIFSKVMLPPEEENKIRWITTKKKRWRDVFNIFKK